ncbi:MAG: DUF2130 domain-containing protein [Saprospiraceae bacterium]|uniref:DUF2130 domain-containing protein n=1 Tax=Candidatus Defluviibacterium haderslevense TaxID=2981993 RepID=A0A9D7SBE2_9BACT|nr:DUF2130 domain-containing protein [Candidatus Defluviibacterium haderslevense]
MDSSTKIICPNCEFEIDVNDVIFHRLDEDLKKQYNSKWQEANLELEQKAALLKKEKESFELKKQNENDLFQERVRVKLREERDQLTLQIRKSLELENADQYQAIQQELNAKSEQIKELNKTKAEIETLKREKNELQEIAQAEAQKKLNELLVIERERISKFEFEKNELVVRELQKQLEAQKYLTEEMKRKQDQGSMQLQGEVQELAIEEWLKNNFTLDTISEIKKGARGADCIQIIHTRSKQNCGSIYYESKRTKDFQNSWIEKFRNDMRDQNANIGVLVTDVLPKDMERMGLRDGIWICTYQEFKGLCFVLRESILHVDLAISSQENKGEKMNMLYSYLTSNEFKLQIESIVDGFTQMHNDLNTEKRSMQGHWKRREKQIQKVLLNTNFMYNSIKGIAGNAIQSIKALELGHTDELDEGNEFDD